MVAWWSWWAALVVGAARARELDPAACAPRFDVQRDKIIRTEESRDMGARYLSELDVGARQECLRLCCETDACDVFVYEEKGPGSCYLFNCGPPEDFRCKFTAHSNFSSGVLAISRRLAELQDQERLAHHEQELANLRSSATASSSTASSTAASTAPPAPPRPSPPQDVERPPTSRCSRYQFACRHGGECIAVYNACDGVPQCADGSDEAPELGCPPAPPAARRTLPPPTATPPALKPLQPLQESAEAAGEGALPERWPHRLAQAQPQHRYSEGAASSHIFSHKGGLLQEPEGAQFPPFEPPWPRRAWPQPPNEGAASSHIFSHKGGLLQEPEGAQFPPFEPPWPRRAWPQPPNGMEGMPGERGWGAYWPEPGPRRAWPVPRSEQELPVYIPPKTMPEIPVVYSSQQQTLRDSAKKGFELLKKEPTEVPAPAAREPPPPQRQPDNKTNKKTAPEKPAAAVPAAAVALPAAPHAHYAEREQAAHEGLSEHPPAAMMLLVLGVLMLSGTLGTLWCRARAAARRRRARGTKPFAHDADYLVNGMYL